MAAIVHITKNHPAVGWVRADQVEEAAAPLINRLRTENEALNSELNQLRQKDRRELISWLRARTVFRLSTSTKSTSAGTIRNGWTENLTSHGIKYS